MNGDRRTSGLAEQPFVEAAEMAETVGTRVSSISARRSALKALTTREREVLLVLAAGESNRVLARRLGIAERTVKAHLTSITRKLGLRSRVEAVLLSLEWGSHLRAEPRDDLGTGNG